MPHFLLPGPAHTRYTAQERKLGEGVRDREEIKRGINKQQTHHWFKAWLYQHGILSRILWPLLVCEVPVSTVVALERKKKFSRQKMVGAPWDSEEQAAIATQMF